MKARFGLLIIAAGLLLIVSCESKKLDPYKVIFMCYSYFLLL